MKKGILKDELVSIFGKRVDGEVFEAKIAYEAENLILIGKTLVTLDLAPLEHCKSINLLILSNNKFEHLDLHPLVHLKNLKRLFLNQNKISIIDLEPLRGCNSLETLDLSNNSLQEIDLHPFSYKSELRALDLSKNPLNQVDISPLFGCVEDFSSFRIDPEVHLVADKSYENSNIIPSALKGYHQKIVWIVKNEFNKQKIIYYQPEALSRRSFHCQIDGAKHPATESGHQCSQCGRYVCHTCFIEMTASGMTVCPYCEGPLEQIQ